MLLSSQRDKKRSTHLSRKARFYKGYRRCGMLSNALEITPCATRLQQVCNKNISNNYRTFFSEAIHWKVSFSFTRISIIKLLHNFRATHFIIMSIFPRAKVRSPLLDFPFRSRYILLIASTSSLISK